MSVHSEASLWGTPTLYLNSLAFLSGKYYVHMCTVVHLSPVIGTLLARDHLFIVEHSQHVTVLLNTIHTQSPLYSTAIFGKSARCTFRDYSIFFFSPLRACVNPTLSLHQCQFLTLGVLNIFGLFSPQQWHWGVLKLQHLIHFYQISQCPCCNKKNGLLPKQDLVIDGPLIPMKWPVSVDIR